MEELFLATINRFPTDREKAMSLKLFAAGREQGAEDLLWALINRVDFIFNI